MIHEENEERKKIRSTTRSLSIDFGRSYRDHRSIGSIFDDDRSNLDLLYTRPPSRLESVSSYLDTERIGNMTRPIDRYN